MQLKNIRPLCSGFKRALDAGGALCILIFLMPMLCPVVWVLQRIQCPGPLFFRQIRVGLWGKPFWILKFRSLPVEECGAEFRFGSWLRRHGWDELPQCVNILQGTMSLVGPRPLLAAEAARGPVRIRRQRCGVLPGITGLAQIQGLRSNCPAVHAVRIRADLAYVRGWTPLLDVRILLKSFRILFPFSGVPERECVGGLDGKRLLRRGHPGPVRPPAWRGRGPG